MNISDEKSPVKHCSDITYGNVNKQLPGFSKIEPYRGLSCVPGNLLAQFLGGDGGVSLPTYPVTKKNSVYNNSP